jgi:Electron transfer DM13
MQVIRERSFRFWLVIAAAVAVVAAAGIYWFEPHQLFVDTRVDEALPTPVDGGRGTTPGETGGSAEGDGSAGAGAAGITTLATGAFSSLAHDTTGMASIVELDDGSRFLRIEDLETDSGPDLRVYLSEAPADGDAGAFDDAFIDLGDLKGNQGNQNYEIPRDADLGDIESVSIWCRRFSVGFGVAPLELTR